MCAERERPSGPHDRLLALSRTFSSTGTTEARHVPGWRDNQILDFTVPTVVVTDGLQSECKQTAVCNGAFREPGPIQPVKHVR
jgi:hypothetical protein